MIPTMENLEVTKRFYYELTAIQVGKIGAFDTLRQGLVLWCNGAIIMFSFRLDYKPLFGKMSPHSSPLRETTEIEPSSLFCFDEPNKTVSFAVNIACDWPINVG